LVAGLDTFSYGDRTGKRVFPDGIARGIVRGRQQAVFSFPDQFRYSRFRSVCAVAGVSLSFCAGGGSNLEHAPVPITVAESRVETPISRGLASASIGMGFFSTIIFFWTPFSSFLSSVGLFLGIISYLRGVRGYRGENYAAIGILICAASLTITVTLNQILRYVQWDY
jgi:hypothetical protein